MKQQNLHLKYIYGRLFGFVSIHRFLQTIGVCVLKRLFCNLTKADPSVCLPTVFSWVCPFASHDFSDFCSVGFFCLCQFHLCLLYWLFYCSGAVDKLDILWPSFAVFAFKTTNNKKNLSIFVDSWTLFSSFLLVCVHCLVSVYGGFDYDFAEFCPLCRFASECVSSSLKFAVKVEPKLFCRQLPIIFLMRSFQYSW